MTNNPNKRKGRAFRWIQEHINYNGNDCLWWPMSCDSHGYGQLIYDSKRYKAHRFMCTLVHGEPPDSAPVARHSCGNGHLGCVNPRHLSWATNSDNQKDRRKHGKHLGAIGPKTDLSAQQIDYIRQSRGKISQSTLAANLGVKIGRIKYWQSHDREPHVQ